MRPSLVCFGVVRFVRIADKPAGCFGYSAIVMISTIHFVVLGLLGLRMSPPGYTVLRYRATIRVLGFWGFRVFGHLLLLLLLSLLGYFGWLSGLFPASVASGEVLVP